MPRPAEIHADEVAALAPGSARRSRVPAVAGVLLLLLLGGAGAWVAVARPLGSRAVPGPPPPAPDNLLGAAWSFEAADGTSPSASWQVPGDAPAGFAFTAEAAVSGATGAAAALGGEAWAALRSATAFTLPPGARAVGLSAVSRAPGLALHVRHEGEGRPPLDVVLASGEGPLSGTTRVLPGYTRVRAGLTSLGAGGVDDVELRALDTAPGHGQELRHGMFDVLAGDPPGLTVFRGSELVLHVQPLTVRDEQGRHLPALASQLPGEGALALPDGTRVQRRSTVRTETRRLVLHSELSPPPAGHPVHEAVLAGALAEAPLGLITARGFERFAGDVRAEGVSALVLGRTQDRLVLSSAPPFAVDARHAGDGTVTLQLGFPGGGEVELALSAEFKEERVLAAQLLGEAGGHEQAGRLGAALAALERIGAEFPYDDEVLAAAQASRARLVGALQEQLDELDRELDDALFLGSARRCRELREEIERLAVLYAGSEAEETLRERGRQVGQRAARLLHDDVQRRRARLSALAGSFEEHGGYPAVVAELRDVLERLLPAPEAPP